METKETASDKAIDEIMTEGEPRPEPAGDLDKPAGQPRRPATSAEMAERLDSVEITKNAKGELAFKVKAYATSASDALDSALETLDRAIAELTARNK